MTNSGVSNERKIVGVGAGGHCRVLLDLCRHLGGYDVIALTDHDESMWGQIWDGVEIVGSDEKLSGLFSDGVTNAFIGVGSIGDHRLRKKLFHSLHNLGFALPALVHPSVILASEVEIARGVQVMAGVVINSNVKISCNTIVNTRAVVEHDCVILSHAHISPGAVLGGGVKVGEGAHVGIGAVVREGVQIGYSAMVAAGAVVVNDVASQSLVMGIPAKAK